MEVDERDEKALFFELSKKRRGRRWLKIKLFLGGWFELRRFI